MFRPVSCPGALLSRSLHKIGLLLKELLESFLYTLSVHENPAVFYLSLFSGESV